MKIAIFYNLPFSGAKRQVMEHVKGLSLLGHIVDVYTTDQEHDIFDPGLFANTEFRYIFNQKTMNVPILKRVSSDLSVFFDLRQLHRQIAADIDKRRYDIALIHTDFLTQAPFILRFLKTKNVYFCLEPLKMAYEYSLRPPDDLGIFNRLYETMNRYVRKKIDRDNARSADHTLAISLFGRELMIQALDLYPGICPLGVDTEIFKPLNTLKKNQVLFVGQKLSINGYEYVTKVIESIPKNIRPELKILSIKKGDKNTLSDADLVTLYNQSIATLSLSSFDTFGLVPLESISCETPVIAFNVAGYRETILDKKVGFLVDFSEEAIAEKVMLLIKNPDLAKKMGKEGRKWILRNWTWKRQIKNLERLLLEFKS